MRRNPEEALLKHCYPVPSWSAQKNGVKGLSEKIVASGFALALLLLSGVGVASYLSLQRLIEHRRWVAHTYQVLDAINDTLSGVTEAESARRGYILADRNRIFLAAYDDGRQKADRGIKAVRQLTSDNLAQQRRLNELEPLVDQRLALLQRSLDLLQQNPSDLATQIALTSQGGVLQQQVEAKLQVMDNEEQTLLQQRSETAEESVVQTTAIGAVGFCLSFGLLAGVYFLLQRQIRVRRRAETALHQANEQLEARVQERTAQLSQMNISLQAEIMERQQAQQALQQVKEGLEIKVQERTAELKQLNEDLVRSNQELEQFAYVASHDLQEPLRAVTGYTQLLVQDYQDRLDESAQEYTAFIVDGARRMQQLIQDLLAYSRVGTRDLVFVSTDCNLVLNQALDNLQVAIAENQAIIHSESLPTVTVDKNQLVQLFQNLLGNAIKFRREAPPQVQISAELNGNEWIFRIRDNGIGMKSRYLVRIFEIFKRLHTRTEFSGTGIGLAICKKIVDRHGGRIWAESEPGVGTAFYFTLPHHDHSNV